MNSLLVEFVALFQNTDGIAFFLIDKNNAEYYRNTILVSNSNDTSGVYNMCLHLIVIMPLPTQNVPLSEDQLPNKINLQNLHNSSTK